MKITDERSHEIAKSRIAGGEEAIARAQEEWEDLPPLLRQAAIDGLRGNLETLRAEIGEYEAEHSTTYV